LQDEGRTENTVQNERLRVLVRSSDGAAIVVPLKTPEGADVVGSSPLVFHGPNYGSLSYISRLGDFTLYDFGLRYTPPARPGLFDAPGMPDPEATPIATVRAYNPGYSVVDLGDTTLDGLAVYHLGLTPVHDPDHHVLREIWIDRATSLPVRYLAELLVNYPFFGQVVEHEVTIYTALREGHLINTRVDGAFHIHATQVDKRGIVKWEVSEVSFPAKEPDWAFDMTQWPEHQGEAIPNLAPGIATPVTF